MKKERDPKQTDVSRVEWTSCPVFMVPEGRVTSLKVSHSPMSIPHLLGWKNKGPSPVKNIRLHKTFQVHILYSLSVSVPAMVLTKEKRGVRLVNLLILTGIESTLLMSFVIKSHPHPSRPPASNQKLYIRTLRIFNEFIPISSISTSRSTTNPLSGPTYMFKSSISVHLTPHTLSYLPQTLRVFSS